MKTGMIKAVIISWIILLLTTLSMTTAKSATVVYLPMITNQGTPIVPDPNATFRLDNLRLWHIEESHGKSTSPFTCGDMHKVQVHIFDVRGDQGELTRLNGVIVKIVHWENGQRVEEWRSTGFPNMDPGVVEFELKQVAEVSIWTDADGHLVSSHTATVTSVPNAIPVAQLIQSGYCQDPTGCQAFVSANQCAGAFSWNVVFKRSY